jgi:hypothetical protein
MIDVCWPSYNAPTSRHGSWDMALLEDILDEENYVHWNALREVPPDTKRIVIVIPGQHHINYIPAINEDLNKFERVVLCIVGDEESLFDATQLNHPNLKIWMQSRKTLVHDKVSHFLPWGYTQETLKYLPECSREKTLDWFFSGQVTHARRQRCAYALQRMPGGLLNMTAGFAQGFSRLEYYKYMAASKLVICPAGYVTPDSFRVWEALEAGCIPIVDGGTSRPSDCDTTNWWTVLLEEEPLFPVVCDWNDLPGIAEEQLRNWETNVFRVQTWWGNYKKKLKSWMNRDITEEM